MPQLNKVLAVFLLLIIAGFVLWALLTRLQTVKTVLSRVFPNKQSQDIDRSTDPPQQLTAVDSVVTGTQLQVEIEKAMQNGGVPIDGLGSVTNGGYEKSVVAGVSEYPKTGSSLLIMASSSFGILASLIWKRFYK
jgi:hypothetical protein